MWGANTFPVRKYNSRTFHLKVRRSCLFRRFPQINVGGDSARIPFVENASRESRVALPPKGRLRHVVIVYIIPVFAILLCSHMAFCIKSLCYHAHSSSMFLCATNHIPSVAISHYVHSCMLPPCRDSCLAFFLSSKSQRSVKVCTALLVACIVYHDYKYK